MSQTTEPSPTAETPAVIAEEPKKLTARSMFAARLKREGKYSEFLAVVEDVMRERDCDKRSAIPEAMKRLGYVGRRHELKKHREWERLQAKTAVELEAERLRVASAERRRVERESIDDEERQFRFERAFAALPTVADPQKEWEWLGAHPAMMRKDRAKTDLKRIELDEDDVLTPPHGAAPSKRAVLQLQHWANAPREFYKAMIGVHKKKQEGDGAGEASQDEDLNEVERMLKDIAAAHARPEAPKP